MKEKFLTVLGGAAIVVVVIGAIWGLTLLRGYLHYNWYYRAQVQKATAPLAERITDLELRVKQLEASKNVTKK